MANSSVFLCNPIPLTLASGANSFVSQWGDKRSATCVGLSLVFYGANPPVGTAQVETSNAPEKPGTGQGIPNNSSSTATNIGDDAQVYTGSELSITLNSTTGLYGAQWQIAGLAARWVRVRYTAGSNVSGLTVNCYMNAPHESP